MQLALVCGRSPRTSGGNGGPGDPRNCLWLLPVFAANKQSLKPTKWLQKIFKRLMGPLRGPTAAEDRPAPAVSRRRCCMRSRSFRDNRGEQQPCSIKSKT